MKFRKYRKLIFWTILVGLSLTVLFGDLVGQIFYVLGDNPTPYNVAERYGNPPDSTSIHLR